VLVDLPREEPVKLVRNTFGSFVGRLFKTHEIRCNFIAQTTTMKATIIFGVILCVTVAVLSRRPEPTLQPYPVVFSASFNESGKCKLTLN
jgi:hypothetical protein